MDLKIIIVFVVIVVMLAVLYKEVVHPSLVFLISVLIFYFSDIITLDEIVSGFSNQQILLIFLLLIISDIIKRSSIFDHVIDKIFNTRIGYKGFLLRMSLIVSPISAWLNNTPIVALMMPYVHDWAQKKKISVSKVMLPLSLIAILGGTATLVGSSTNLIVNGLAIESGIESLGLFDFYFVGIPLVIMGTLFIIFFSKRLLPDRRNIWDDLSEKTREYIVETVVPKESPFIGKTVLENKLRNLRGLFLVEIIRDGRPIAPVSPRERIHEGDFLLFAGETKTIMDLISNEDTLELAPVSKELLEKKNENIELVEVIVSHKSELIGKTPKETNFRKKYDAAIVAVQRYGSRVSGKLGRITFNVGDLIILVTGKDFQARPEADRDFYRISRLKHMQYFGKPKKIILFGGLIAAFLLASFKILPLFAGLLLLLLLLALQKTITLDDLKKTLDLNLFFILVLALAIGKAVHNSGAADFIAENVLHLFSHDPISILIGIFIITVIITNFVTNAAAVAITFPIAISMAAQSGINDVKPFILTVAIAGSAGFLTPFSYQTNLMVYGPGNYRFKDYLKIGIPLTIIYMITCIIAIAYFFNLY